MLPLTLFKPVGKSNLIKNVSLLGLDVFSAPLSGIICAESTLLMTV